MEWAHVDVKALIDVAIGSPHGGRVNFWALHALMNCFAIKLNMLDDDIGTYLGEQLYASIKSRLQGGEDEPLDSDFHNEGEDETTMQSSVSKDDILALMEEQQKSEEPEAADEVTQPENDEADPESKANEGEQKVKETEHAEAKEDEKTEQEHFESSPADKNVVKGLDDLSVKATELVESLSISFPSFETLSVSLTSKRSSSDTIVKSIEDSEPLIVTDQYTERFKEIADNWAYVVQAVIVLVKIVMEHHRTHDSALKQQLLQLSIILDSNMKRPSAANLLFSDALEKLSDTNVVSQQPMHMEKEKTTDFSAYKELLDTIVADQKIIFNKLNDIALAVSKYDFDGEYKKLKDLEAESKNFLTKMNYFTTSMQNMLDRLMSLEKKGKMFDDRLDLMDTNKIEMQQVRDILDRKPDFQHLKRKVSLVDYIQHKYCMEGQIAEAFNQLAYMTKKMDIIDDIRRIFVILKDTKWREELSEAFDKKFKNMKIEVLNFIEEQSICGNLGVPLLCNLPHSLNQKKVKPHKACPDLKKTHYQPVLDELEKSCIHRLKGGIDLLQECTKPTTSSKDEIAPKKLIKRTPTAPGKFK